MTNNIFQPLTGIIDAKIPEQKIDGLDNWPLKSGKEDVQTPHDALYFYWGRDLQAVISGKWKMHFPHDYRTLNGRPGGTGGMPVKYEQAHTNLVLYNLDKDIGEQHDVSAEHPDIVKRLSEMGKKFDEELKKTKREPGRV